ncbi:hypothetical protein L0128_15560 [candidate division KSB1 bacterium]|nr:hypothetical protein [candidate division KSB1 bacterium]
MKKINAVLMVRKIRDKQSREITSKSIQDTINYFRKKANEINQKIAKIELNQS